MYKLRALQPHRPPRPSLGAWTWFSLVLLLLAATACHSLHCSSRQSQEVSRPSSAGKQKRAVDILHLWEVMPSTANCSELYFQQPADHNDFSPGRRHWNQRYYLCTTFWNSASSPAAPILFYAGNEGNVEGFVNNTGLMWELGREWGAMLVFAEHRYYGKSQPVRGSGGDPGRFRYLSIDQVLTDYVRLIEHVKSQHGIQAAPVVAFGGSYGGVLAGYLRMKFPNVVYAAVASSAPFRCNLIGQGWDPTSYWEVVTRTASGAAGSPANCVPNIRVAFSSLFNQSTTHEGRSLASQALRLCPGVLERHEDAPAVALFLQMAFNTAAMGSLPFASTYFSDDSAHPLPPWVMRAVCKHLTGNLDTPQQLLSALSGAVGVIYNVSGNVGCYSRQLVHDEGLQAGPGAEAYIYQVCSEFVFNESFFPTTGATDMFWAQPQPFNSSALRAFCRKQWGEGGPAPDLSLQPLLYSCGDLSAASNIILSNGLPDPWSSGGYLENVSSRVVSFVLPEGGHHADLFFTHPDDLPSFAEIRRKERTVLSKWLAAYDGRGYPLLAGAQSDQVG